MLLLTSSNAKSYRSKNTAQCIHCSSVEFKYPGNKVVHPRLMFKGSAREAMIQSTKDKYEYMKTNKRRSN